MALIIENVVKRFGEKIILNGINYRFEKNKIYGLLGRNGAGKTTLFNCISKYEDINKGYIFLEGNRQKTISEDTIGYVYDKAHLPSFMTGLECVNYFIKVNQKRLKDPNLSAEDYLQKIGIQEKDYFKLIRDYSHGMQNKLQMILTFMIHYDVLLLDEPLTSFDPVAVKELKKIIVESKNDSIIIFSTHVLQLAQELCDDLVLLKQGKLESATSIDLHSDSFEDAIIDQLQEGSD